MCCANVGIPVIILDIDEKNLKRGMSLVKANYERSRSMSSGDKAAALRRIRPTANYGELANVDLVVEAVFENMKVKKKIFKTLSDVCVSFACVHTAS